MRNPSVLILLLATVSAAPAVGQTPTGPNIGYVYPAGGCRGTSFEVTVGGQRLRGLADAFVSGPGVRAKVKSYSPLLSQRDLNALREEATKLQRKRSAARQPRRGARGGADDGPRFTAEDQQRLVEIQRKIADRNRRREIPALAELAVVQISVAPDAPVGNRELRLVTASGPTNPLVFCVGELPEYNEVEESPERRVARSRFGGRGSQEVDETRLELPAVGNGQILPGDVDRFRFRARKGQKVVATVAARELIPYLADAVPGWFQATVALRDALGNELMHVDDYRFNPDPVLFCAIPEDGEYVVEIRDALYRGREDFVYRIAVGELPFVTGVFPLGGPVGKPTQVAIRGVNLDSDKVSLAAQAMPGVSMIRARGQQWTSNALPFVRDTLPEALEQEPNQDPAAAQAIALPLILNGRIGKPGDVDVFRFEGRYGQEVVAEVQARRLQSPLDSILRLTDANGKQIAINDDLDDVAAGRTTHHADSYLRVKLPRSGTYFLHLADTQRHGGEDYAYRLRVGVPLPEFDLRVVPSCINTRAGSTAAFEVRAVRRDGFQGPIELSLDGAPKDFELAGGTIPAGADRVRVTLTVPAQSAEPGAFDSPIELRILGKSRFGKREIAKHVVAADDVMQAFIYRHLVPAQALLVSIRGRGGVPLRIRRSKPVILPVGGTVQVKLPFGSRWEHRWVVKNKVRLALDAPPPGVKVQRLTQSDGGFEVTLRVDGKAVQPGTAGNLVFQVFANPPPPRPNDKNQRPAVRRGGRRALGMLPAIPYRVAKKGGRRP